MSGARERLRIGRWLEMPRQEDSLRVYRPISRMLSVIESIDRLKNFFRKSGVKLRLGWCHSPTMDQIRRAIITTWSTEALPPLGEA